MHGCDTVMTGVGSIPLIIKFYHSSFSNFGSFNIDWFTLLATEQSLYIVFDLGHE